MKIKQEGPFQNGLNLIVGKQTHPEGMGMDFLVLSMQKGDSFSADYNEEAIFTLLFGEVTFKWEDQEQSVSRANCFHVSPVVLHVPQNTHVEILAQADTEVAIAKIPNSRSFPARLLQGDALLCANEERGTGTLNECSTRLVRTFFDRSNCPETNFFVGEVVSYPGKWSSYPPHQHVEPEIYFYKFLPENGYGLAEYGDDAFKVHNNDATLMPSNMTHAQATAPGYAEYYLWCIPLRDDQNIVTTTVAEHAWTTEPGAKYFPEI